MQEGQRKHLQTKEPFEAMTAAAATIAFQSAKIGGDEAVRRVGHESQTLVHGATMNEGIPKVWKRLSERSEPLSERMRAALIESAPRRPGEPSDSWLRRCADACGLTERRARGVYYREARQISADEFERAQEAAARGIHNEIADLRARIAALEKEIEDDASRLDAGQQPLARALPHLDGGSAHEGG